MASTSRKSKQRVLTASEQSLLLANFYENIYQGERNFGDNALPNFIDDNDEAGNQDDDIEFAMETLVDAGDDDQDDVLLIKLIQTVIRKLKKISNHQQHNRY